MQQKKNPADIAACQQSRSSKRHGNGGFYGTSIVEPQNHGLCA